MKSDCRPLFAEYAEVEKSQAEEIDRANEWLVENHRDIQENFDPKVVKVPKQNLPFPAGNRYNLSFKKAHGRSCRTGNPCVITTIRGILYVKPADTRAGVRFVRSACPVPTDGLRRIRRTPESGN